MSNISEYLELERRVEFEKSRAEAALACNTELNKQYFEKCSEVDKLKDKNKVLRNYLEIAMNGGDFTHQKEFWNTMHKFLREKN